MNTTATELEAQPNNPDRPSRAAPACTGTGYEPIDTHNALTGRDLRYVLTRYIEQGCTTVKALAQRLAADGYTVWGRVSKVISDALRWEIRNGRVRRLKRGVYTIGTIPRTTHHRIAARARDLSLAPHVVAMRRNHSGPRRPKQTPPPDRHWRKWQRERRSEATTSRVTATP